MTTPTTPRFHTAQLGPIRQIVQKLASYDIALGDIFQVDVVVDANIVIRDLLYRVRYPDRGSTILQELIASTVVVAHAPQWLESELAKIIPQAAAKRKVSADKLWQQWNEYRRLLVWDHSLTTPPPCTTSVRDPKDLPYVELEHKIGASGILTGDSDISHMGGHMLPTEFLTHTRDYARAITPVYQVRLLGLAVPAITLTTLVKVTQGLIQAIARLPPHIRTLMVVSAILIMSHPRSRRCIIECLTDVVAGLSRAAGVVQDFIREAATLHYSSQLDAETHLAAARTFLRPPIVEPKSKQTVRRRRPRVRITYGRKSIA